MQHWTFDRYVGVVGLVLTVIALCVSLYTLHKVQSVQKAQVEARSFTQELLDIDGLEVDLVRVMDKLRDTNDPDSPSLVGELGKKLGMLMGVRKALVSSSSVRVGQPVTVETGFFSQDFLDKLVKGSRLNLDIITGRTKLVSGFFILDQLRQACERGVQVRLVGLSPDCADEILNDAAKTVSHPAPKDAADYRRQIIDNRDEIVRGVESWPIAAQHNFAYRLNHGVPRVSLLRSDNVVAFGFLQFYRDAQPMELKDRQYFRIPMNSLVAQTSLRHFDLVWSDSDIVLPVQATVPAPFLAESQVELANQDAEEP